MSDTIPAWVADYIGREFAEHGRGPRYDCWGLVRTVRIDRGCPAPLDYADQYASTADRTRIPETFRRGLAAEWRAVSEAAELDIVVFRILDRPMHVGIVVAPRWFLHIERGINACVDRLDAPRWARRIDGVYRYVG